MSMKRNMMMVALAASFSVSALAATASVPLSLPLNSQGRAQCTLDALRDCVAGTECLSGTAAGYGVPESLQIDFAKRQVSGEAKRQSKVRDFEKKDGQILLQGREAGYGWSIAIDEKSGDMILSLLNREGAFVLFGHCTNI